jgi:hypothetical protein
MSEEKSRFGCLISLFWLFLFIAVFFSIWRWGK